MDIKLSEICAKRIANPIAATFGIEGDILDVEILLPIDKNTGSIRVHIYKEKIKIVNAVALL